jgi:N-methylhydantoinase A
MIAAFHARHDALYGYSMPGAPVELINLRVAARGLTSKPDFARSEQAGDDPSAARKRERRAYFDGGFQEVVVFDGLRLRNGNVVPGPAIVEQPTTTIVVPSDYQLTVDDYDNYLIHPNGTDLGELRKLLRSEED